MIGPFFDILTFGWGPFFDHPAIVFDHLAIVFDDPANAGKCRPMPANAGKCRQMLANAGKCQQLVEKRCVFQLLDGPVLRPPANAGKCRQMPSLPSCNSNIYGCRSKFADFAGKCRSENCVFGSLKSS